MTDQTMEQRVNAMFDHVMIVAEQVRNDAEVTDDLRNMSKRLNAASTMLQDIAGKVGEIVNVPESDIFALATTLADYADKIGPKSANVLWNEEELQKEIKFLLTADALGDILTPDQSTIIKGIAVDMAKGSTVRGPRGVAATIDGKAVKVVITNAANDKVGQLSGNTVNSPSNIATRLADLVGLEDKKSKEYGVLKEFSRRACDGETLTIGKGEDRLTLTPVMAED